MVDEFFKTGRRREAPHTRHASRRASA